MPFELKQNFKLSKNIIFENENGIVFCGAYFFRPLLLKAFVSD